MKITEGKRYKPNGTVKRGRVQRVEVREVDTAKHEVCFGIVDDRNGIPLGWYWLSFEDFREFFKEA